jgi:hypothetical protein
MTDINQPAALTDAEFDALVVAAGLAIPEDMRAQVQIGAHQLRLMAARLHACDCAGNLTASSE